jgi:hypothetical protein
MRDRGWGLGTSLWPSQASSRSRLELAEPGQAAQGVHANRVRHYTPEEDDDPFVGKGGTMEEQRTLSKAKVVDTLRRAGYTPELIDEVASQLPDPVDLDQSASLLARYGITRGQLMDRLGGTL